MGWLVWDRCVGRGRQVQLIDGVCVYLLRRRGLWWGGGPSAQPPPVWGVLEGGGGVWCMVLSWGCSLVGLVVKGD